MAMTGWSLNYCHRCGVQLAPDDFDGFCGDCDDLEDEADLVDPGDIRLGFGKYTGCSLGWLLWHDPGYMAWLAREARDEPVRLAAEDLLVTRDARLEARLVKVDECL